LKQAGLPSAAFLAQGETMRRLLAILMLSALAACATVPKLGAASDVHAFLVAVRDGDRPRFDQHVDYPALKSQLKSRVLAEGPALVAAHPEWGAIGALLTGPLVNVAVEQLVRPEVFRAIAIEHGYRAGKPIPNTLEIAHVLQTMDGGRVCIPAKGMCQLVFANEEGGWRLIAFEGDVKSLTKLKNTAALDSASPDR
jgi:hypothetical protein